MLGVADEDVVCRLIPFTLIDATSTWYFSLRIGSITSWDDFQWAFLDKFGDDKTHVALVLELPRLKMETKEKVKDFNIRFNTFFNRIMANATPTNEMIMEFYITALLVPIVMLVKRSNAQTLQGAIDEAIKVENEMINLTTCHHTIEEKKASQSSKNNNGSDDKAIDIKEKDTTDVEVLHRIIKKLTNTVIDMKRNSRESTNGNGGNNNNKKSFKPFYRKKVEGGHSQPALLAPPNEGILNMEDLALIRSLLTKEEAIADLEQEQEDEEDYEVEEPRDEAYQVNIL